MKTGINLQLARYYLEQDQVVAIPTETVYGLAGNALSEKAVLQIFEVKNRPFFDPLIVHVPSLEAGFLYATFSKEAEELARKVWPGPLTLILPKLPNVPDLVTSGLDTVGIRVPSHPLTLALLESLNFPLAAPSANPFGYTSPTTAAHVADQLGEKIGYILDGGSCEVGLESTIASISGKTITIYRPGGITSEAFREMGYEVIFPESHEMPLTPGSMKKHYSTRKPMRLFFMDETPPFNKLSKVHLLRFDRLLENFPREQQHLLSSGSDMKEAAKNLFALMRELDSSPLVESIWAWELPEVGLGKAINDRLRRAAAKD